MIEIQVNNLVKSFEVGKNVLDGLTFQVDQGERVGLLGRNGAGKTTLFKILTGELDYDEGTVVVGQGRRVGLISQIPVYPAGCTVEDVLRSAFARLESLAEEMRALEARMAAGESDPAILKRYGTLSERFEAFGGYDTDVAVNKIANGLSIPDSQRSQLFDSLSGGEKTRVNLGRLILEDTDILLLDEPTNHLDLHATEWLEEYIRSFHGTVVTISHDRYFLDRTVTRVIEIQDGKAEFYSGNYSFYAVEKERRYQERMKQYEKEQAKIAQEAGACAVMALERIPADIRAAGGVSRMSDPKMIQGIQEAVSIPVMAKCRIGHFAEAQILEAIEIDYIDESEVLSPADDVFHIDKTKFNVPFVCGAKDLGEALRRINEGASMIRTKGEPGTGDIVQAVRHMRKMNQEIAKLVSMREDELFQAAKELQVPYELVKQVYEEKRLPVVNFAAGGVATPADAALMMQLGAEGVFVGSGIFKSGNPAKRAAAIVQAVTNYNDSKLLAELSKDLGEAMVGINEQEIELLMAERGK